MLLVGVQDQLAIFDPSIKLLYVCNPNVHGYSVMLFHSLVPDPLVLIEFFSEVGPIDAKSSTYWGLQELYSSSSCDEDTAQFLDSVISKQ